MLGVGRQSTEAELEGPRGAIGIAKLYRGVLSTVGGRWIADNHTAIPLYTEDRCSVCRETVNRHIRILKNLSCCGIWKNGI